MNYNITAYMIYLGITAFVIIVVGRICYRNGNIFVGELMPEHAGLCQRINSLLLTGYYLLNIGYCCITLVQWHKIESLPALVEAIAFHTSLIVLALAGMHYLNIFLIKNYAQKLIH